MRESDALIAGCVAVLGVVLVAGLVKLAWPPEVKASFPYGRVDTQGRLILSPEGLHEPPFEVPVQQPSEPLPPPLVALVGFVLGVAASVGAVGGWWKSRYERIWTEDREQLVAALGRVSRRADEAEVKLQEAEEKLAKAKSTWKPHGDYFTPERF